MSPTFGSIGGAEPSTLTFKLATVKQTINSSVMHKEVQVIGDPDSSVAIAAVLAAVPASTAWGLVTREAGGFLSSVGGIVVIQGNSTVAPLAGSTWNVRPIQSSAADLQMTATQGTNPWIIAGNSTVAPLAGSTWNTRPLQSSAADLQMTATPAAGSTWRTQPGSTLWASSAGFHFDSSGSLQVAASFTGSTGPLTISQLLDSSGGSVAMADSANNAIRSNIVAGSVSLNFGTMQSSAAPAGNSSALLVRIAGGPSSAADCVLNVNIVSPVVGQAAMAASFPVVLASNQSVVNVGGNKTNNNAAPGAAQFPVMGALASSAVPSYTHGNQAMPACDTSGSLLVTFLDSSNAMVKPGDVTNSAIRVNVVAGAAGGSTIVTVAAFGAGAISSAVLAGNSSALSVRNVWSSTAADQPVRAVLSSTSADNPVVATIGTNLQSSVAPSSGSSGLVVRQVWDAILTTASTNAFAASTSLSIQSSGAALRSYVTAYSILSTNGGPHRIKFYSSGTMTWPVVFAAISSAVSGANLANYPYIFRTAASEALTLQIGSGASTIGGYQVAVSYFRAP